MIALVVKVGLYLWQSHDCACGKSNSAGTAGKCWMVKKNLALKLSAGTYLTAEDSDIGVAPDTLTKWLPRYNTKTSLSGGIMSKSVYDYSWYLSSYSQYGVYYQWNAATAGWSGADEDYTNDVNATRSVCPKGWRLPTVGFQGPSSPYTYTGDFGELLGAYGWDKSWTSDQEAAWMTNTWMADPMRWQLGNVIGVWSNADNAAREQWGNTFGTSVSEGLYWSGAAGSSSGARKLEFKSSGLDKYGGGLARYIGCSVRCVARGG